MQVLPQCGHAVHEDAPEKVRLAPVPTLHSFQIKQKENDCSCVKKTVLHKV